MTSPPFRVPSARQVCRLTEFLMNLTEPSPRSRLTPPGWLLLGGMTARLTMKNPHERVFGVVTWRMMCWPSIQGTPMIIGNLVGGVVDVQGQALRDGVVGGQRRAGIEEDVGERGDDPGGPVTHDSLAVEPGVAQPVGDLGEPGGAVAVEHPVGHRQAGVGSKQRRLPDDPAAHVGHVVRLRTVGRGLGYKYPTGRSSR